MSKPLIAIDMPGVGERLLSRDQALAAAFSWYQTGQMAEAELACRQVLASNPGDADGLRLLATIQIQKGQAKAAIVTLTGSMAETGAVQLADHPQLQMLLARAYREVGDGDLALDILRRLAKQFPDQSEVHSQLGVAQHLLGDLAGARDAYSAAAALDPNSASLKANLAAVLLQLGDAAGAAAHASSALGLDPAVPGAKKVLGCAKANLGQPEVALAALGDAVKSHPEPDAWYQLGVVLDELGQWDGSLDAHRSALKLQPGFGPALSEALFMARRLCRWDDSHRDELGFEQALDAGSKGLKPFSYLSQNDHPRRQQRCASLWAEQIRANAGFATGPLPVTPWRARQAGADQALTVGFVSSGFHRHPTACLTAEFFELLDREKIRPVAFSTGPDDRSELRQRIVHAMDGFHHLQGHSFADIGQRIGQEQVDILVDLRGYGGGAVTEVMVSRPAPVQVNWLAYPGTLGSTDFMDYVVMDRFIATDEVLAHTNEAPVLMPASYQPTDTTRQFARHQVSRSEAGLPVEGMVFASFNNSYKFSPPLFDVWMDILKAVPGSVLWLLAGKAGTSTDDNLRRQARLRGVDPQRLIMMPKLPHLDYLARLSLADLFLDTLPYNAHTTASDALWAGCPVLTCAGRSFAARVAGSLLHSAGLPDLVTGNLSEYQRRAVELGNHGQLRAELKQRVSGARSSALFDTAGFCRNLEAAFLQMAKRAAAGLAPAPIDLSQR